MPVCPSIMHLPSSSSATSIGLVKPQLATRWCAATVAAATWVGQFDGGMDGPAGPVHRFVRTGSGSGAPASPYDIAALPFSSIRTTVVPRLGPELSTFMEQPRVMTSISAPLPGRTVISTWTFACAGISHAGLSDLGSANAKRTNRDGEALSTRTETISPGRNSFHAAIATSAITTSVTTRAGVTRRVARWEWSTPGTMTVSH